MKKRRAKRKKVEVAVESEKEILEEISDFEREKEEKLLNLIVQMMVRITLKDHYETSD